MIATLVPLQAGLIALVGAGGACVVFARDPLRQAIVLGVYSVLLGTLFVVFQAPDVALSELVVGSTAFPFVLLVALTKIRGPRNDDDQEQ